MWLRAIRSLFVGFSSSSKGAVVVPSVTVSGAENLGRVLRLGAFPNLFA